LVRIIGLEQTVESTPLPAFAFPERSVLVLGRETTGMPPQILQALDCCVEIPQLGVVRSLNVHVSGALAIYEYSRQRQRWALQSSHVSPG
jgi:tRNA G18 (ribose-2'-O)-methylase SpoU